MRAKQSSTASGIFSRSGTLKAPIPIRAAAILSSRRVVANLEGPGVAARVVAIRSGAPIRKTKGARAASWAEGADSPQGRRAPQLAGVAQGEGLLHDTRNLMGALGLYCDLLSVPGVLKAEHCHYAEELRMLGTRSGTLMERLVLSLPGGEDKLRRPKSPAVAIAEEEERISAMPVSLREVVERCSGLLGQVAGGRAIELNYGPAASTPILAGQEDVERILVNLVRNAAAALDRRGQFAGAKIAQTVRIGVGLLHGGVGEPKPWPFLRVRLTVEDSGCGIAPQQLERLLSGSAPLRNGHGIGFRVVRELVAAGDGDLRMMSTLGRGTCVQIEWPVAVPWGAQRSLSRSGVTAAEATQVGDGRWPAC